MLNSAIALLVTSCFIGSGAYIFFRHTVFRQTGSANAKAGLIWNLSALGMIGGVVLLFTVGCNKESPKPPEGIIQKVRFEAPALFEVDLWNRGGNGVIVVEVIEYSKTENDEVFKELLAGSRPVVFPKVIRSWKKDQDFTAGEIGKIAIQVPGVDDKEDIAIKVHSQSDTASYDFKEDSWSR